MLFVLTDGDTLAVGCADGNLYLFQTHSNGYMYKIDFILSVSQDINTTYKKYNYLHPMKFI